MNVEQSSKSLVANNLHKVFDDKIILDQESLSINSHDKLGLVGKNGSGKSTLIKILAGIELPDSGQIINSSLKIGYLAQDSTPDKNKTVYEIATENIKKIADALEEFNKMSSDFKIDNHTFMNRYNDLMEILNLNNGYDLPERVNIMLKELNINRPLTAKISTLSGGETMRLGLIRILISNPDILLLDEPTNHLDLQGNLFLRDFLQKQQGGYLIVSHDRDLLDEVTTTTIELEDGKLRFFGGNYSFYKKQKEIESAALEREFVLLSKERNQIERLKEKERERSAHSSRKGKQPKDHDTFQAGFFKDQADITAGKKVKDLEKRLEEVRKKLGETEQKTVKTIKPSFKESESYRGKVLITTKNVQCSYDGNEIVKNVNLEIRFGDKIALFGNNGAGKTTLIQGLLGVSDVNTQGEIWKANNLNIQILDQKYSLVDREKTVLENITSINRNISLTDIRNHLAKFMFTGTYDVNKKAGLLSGGEIARLAIAMVVTMPIDVLILDEPTNNLDISSIDEIEKALTGFEGGIFLISHDLSFLKAIGVDKSFIISNKKFQKLLNNPSDDESFKKELLNYFQTMSS